MMKSLAEVKGTCHSKRFNHDNKRLTNNNISRLSSDKMKAAVAQYTSEGPRIWSCVLYTTPCLARSRCWTSMCRVSDWGAGRGVLSNSPQGYAGQPVQKLLWANLGD